MQNANQANQVNQMQGNAMERQGSQLDMSGSRSQGSPHSGDAPSPKRQRTDGSAPQMNQARPGQAGQVQGHQVGLPITASAAINLASHPTAPFTPNPDMQNLLQSKGFTSEDVEGMNQEQLAQLSAMPQSFQAKSVEVYRDAMTKRAEAGIANVQKTNSNASKGIPPNNAMVPGGAQSSPMSQQGMEAPTGDFYNGNARMGMQPNGAAGNGQQNGQQNGNHALQDYQMQLMLLEQQNKKRLLMARQEQDGMSHSVGPGGPNGGEYWLGGMRRSHEAYHDADCLPGRGSPQPGMMDPNANPAMRAQMIMGPNGQPMMRPPSSHPMNQQQMMQAEMMRAQMMPNGGWPGGQPPPGMMPGQQPGQPPNMTPRAGNMPPPPAPAPGNNGTQPSSPAQPPAPPTPSTTNKAKPGTKKDGKNNKVSPRCDCAWTEASADRHFQAANKKGGAAAATNNDDNAPPTPTPPPPVTPSAAASFNQNKNLPMANGQPHPGQNNANSQAGAVQPPQPDMNAAPFGELGMDQFGNMEFADLGGADVLESFDFDSFLNNDDQGMGFDANFAFGDGPIETDGIN